MAGQAIPHAWIRDAGPWRCGSHLESSGVGSGNVTEGGLSGILPAVRSLSPPDHTVVRLNAWPLDSRRCGCWWVSWPRSGNKGVVLAGAEGLALALDIVR